MFANRFDRRKCLQKKVMLCSFMPKVNCELSTCLYNCAMLSIGFRLSVKELSKKLTSKHKYKNKYFHIKLKELTLKTTAFFFACSGDVNFKNPN